MSTFNPNIPQSGDLLSDSQQDLLDNMQQLDASFLIDHYTFSDLTVNNGKHRQVTTPLAVAPDPIEPPTTVDPKLFGYFPPATNVPLIQYSKGINNAVPSPVTLLQSPAAGINILAGNTTDLIDLSGLTQCYGTVTANNLAANNFYLFGSFWYRGAGTLVVQKYSSPTGLNLVTDAGQNILRLQAGAGGSAQTIWTVQLWRTI